jgi:cell division protein FtsI/penicillin-binding protein 2
MSIAFIATWRLWLMIIAITCCYGGIFGKLYYWHVVEQKDLRDIALESRKSLVVKKARRGTIVDRQGNILATARPVFVVGIDPQEVRDEDTKKFPQLASILNIPLEYIKACVEKKTRIGGGRHKQEIKLIQWHKLADEVNHSTYEKVKSLRLKSVYGNRKYQRHYPNQSLASHLLGFVNKDGIACTGIERFMDFYLRGQNGWHEIERDGSCSRREMVQFRNREVMPNHGLNVELTIDMVIQNIIEQELKRLKKEYSPKSASIIVSDPFTGHILGMGNIPDFNPNVFWKFPLESYRNRAATDVYEPGSIFKIVAASAALNEALIAPDTVFDCSLSEMRYNGRIIRFPHDHKPLGNLTFEQIIIKSSNRGAAQIGLILGEQKLYDYADHFGFGKHTGLGFCPEVKGTLHKISDWDSLTITRLPVGYAVNATPLQVHLAMSVIANGGILMKPMIVQRIFDENQKNIRSFTPQAKQRVITVQTAQQMAEILTQVTTPQGTALKAAIPLFQVAGKTGTTQKIIHGQYSNEHHVVSFSGFFPAENPRIVITVVVDDPQIPGAAYGGMVAAPSFKNIGEQLISYLAIEPNKTSSDFFVINTNQLK